MKVLMTADTIGGVWTYCIDLCKGLQQFDVEIHLVTMGEKMKSWQRQEAEALDNVVVHETLFKLEWMKSPWDDIKACSEFLLQLERETEPQLIHLNCYAYGSLPFKAPVLVVAHSDVLSWFREVKGEEPSTEWSDYFSVVQKGLLGAAKVIAPSKAVLHFILDIYKIKKGEVIYNGRNANLFTSGPKQPLVFAMGRIWDEAKNTKLLVEAAPFIQTSIRIAGENNFEQNKFETAGNNVDFPGKLSSQQISAELAAAAIYVLPAKYEPFGLSALEAALSGCALVLGDIPSLREIWQDAAIYVDTNNAKKLASTINQLINEKKTCDVWRQRARERAEQFSLEATVQHYWQDYKELAKQTVNIQTKEIV